MATDQTRPIGESLERLFDGGTVSGLSERQLLDRFLTLNDPTAFEAIVARHGPMVLGICRRWLDDPNDADDAFQATFLVLVRKARDLRQRDLLASWLHGVALRVARRAWRKAQTRRRREPALPAGTDPMDTPQAQDLDLGTDLHEELARLPRDYRLPLVLCYLEGRTHEQAALELGWPIGTVKGRLARAREVLRKRLASRGLAPTSSLVVTALQQTPQAVPAALLNATVRAASAGKIATATTVSGAITLLTQETLRAMWISKITSIGAAGTLVAALAAGGAAIAQHFGPGPGRAAVSQNAPTPGQAVNQPAGPTTPGPADGLTAELERKRLEAARALWDRGRADFLEGRLPLIVALSASEKLRDAEIERVDPRDPSSADDNHIKRLSDLIIKLTPPPDVALTPAISTNLIEANLALAEARLRRARRLNPPNPTPPPPAAATPAGPGGGMGGFLVDPNDTEARVKAYRVYHYRGLDRDPRTQAVLEKLEEIRPFTLDNTTLEEALQYIKTITTNDSDMPNGIQIYLDEIGIQQSIPNITPTSEVKLRLDAVPIRAALRFILRQRGLVYAVKDGILIVTSPEGLLDEIDDDTEVVKAGP